MACVLCDCFKLDCTAGCADFNFILDGNPVLAEETGDYELYYEQTGQVPKTVLLPFTIGDPIVFAGTLFSSIGLVKFQLTSPTALVFEYTAPNAIVYTCFQFDRRYVQGNSSNSNQMFAQLCTLCEVIEAIQGIIAGGDASAANQLTEIARLESIIDNQINGTQLVNLITGFNLESTQLLIQSVLNDIQTNTVGLGTESTLQLILTALSGGGGDATAANQVLEIIELQSLNAKDFATEASSQAIQGILASIDSYIQLIQPSVSDIETNSDTIRDLLINKFDNSTSDLLTELVTIRGILNNAATAANQVLEITELQNLNLKDFATETTLASVLANLISIDSNTNALNTPLSSRASEATLLLTNTYLSTIQTLLNNPLTVNTITGFNLEATQLLIKGVLDNIKLKTDNLDVALSTRNVESTQLLVKDNIGATNEAVAPTDTSTSGLNGLFKRLLQRITTLITAIGSPFQAGGSISNTSFGASQTGVWSVGVNNFPATQNVNVTSSVEVEVKNDSGNPIPINGTITANAGTNLNTSALSLEATQQTQSNRIGDLTETAPATDTASSGLNGRLQRIAQRLTSLISLLPTSLGQKTMASSLAVVISSDQSAIDCKAPNGVTPTIASVTAVASLNAGTQTLIAANSNRKKLMIHNNTNRIIFVLVGSGTANVTTSFSYQIPALSTVTLNESTDCDVKLAFQYSISQNSASGTVLITSIV